MFKFMKNIKRLEKKTSRQVQSTKFNKVLIILLKTLSQLLFVVCVCCD